MVKKIVAYILVFAMIVSLTVVPVSASGSFGNIITDSSSATVFDDYLERQFIVNISLLDFVSSAWNVIDRCFSAAGLDNVHTLDALYSVATRWNQQMNAKSNWPNLLSYIVTSGFDSVPVAKVVFDDSLGVYRLQEVYSGLWLVNSSGHFPYYRPESSGSIPDPVLPIGQWLEQRNFNESTALWHVVSNYELNEYRDQWLDIPDFQHSRIMETENYFWLVASVGARPMVLCDKYGYPYYVPKEGKTAIGTENNYYQNTTNQYVDDSTTNNYFDYENNEYEYNDNSTNVNVMDGGSALVGSPIDINNGIINVGGKLMYIDNITYDASTQNYYVNAHDEYVYNSTTNNYTTNFNTFKFEYHVDYTSVTYIGQTEQYNKRYEMYYQLPDGRSSADLTAEDLEQLSLVFTDVIQYSRTADNLDLRALYHFDGNTDDDSYWSYCSDFDWSKGASLTYMDEGTFGGSLYLDETEHDFTITLPNNDAAADWTLQFRYYQSHTPDPVYDSYLKVGQYVVLQFTGSNYQTGLGLNIAPTSVGSWNEICIIRCDGCLYYYINGVFYLKVVDDFYHSNTINFHFGSEQQTYKKIDELRFTSSVVYSPGSDYTPSVVPFDTNLTLVLPDSGTLEEQGITIVPAEDNLLADVSLDDWTDFGTVSRLHSDIGALFYGHGVDGHWFPFNWDHPIVMYNPDCISFVDNKSSIGVEFSSSTTYFRHVVYGRDLVYPANSIFVPVSVDSDGQRNTLPEFYNLFGFKDSVYYTFSVVLSDGSYSYAVFKLTNGIFAGFTSLNNCDGVEIVHRDYGVYDSGGPINGVHRIQGLGVQSSSDLSVDIVHMELVEGTRPQFQFSKLYPSADLEPEVVIPDEYLELDTPVVGNMFDSYGVSDWSSVSVVDGFFGANKPYFTGNPMFSMYMPMESKFVYNKNFVSFSQGDAGTVVDFGGNVPHSTETDSSISYIYEMPKNALFLPTDLRVKVATSSDLFWGLATSSVYTLSVVLADGSHSSITFSLGSTAGSSPVLVSKRVNSVISFELGYAGHSTESISNGIYIYSSSFEPVEIVYVELVKGTTPLFSTSRVASVYSAADLTKSPMLAVRTNRTITGYQIGGVRPSYPTKGLVYAMVENSRITSLQQYTGSAWEAVDGRIWTGSRWIPYSSFDVFTLQDYYDIIGGSGDDYEYIYTESGFWRWLQGAWTKMLQKLDAIILALGGNPDALPGGDPVDEQDLTFWQRVKRIFENALADVIESLLDLITRVLDAVLGVIYDLLDFFFSMLTDAVVKGIGGLFDAFTDEVLLQFFHSEEPLLDHNGQPVLDENGEPVMVKVVALPSGVAGVFAFISAAIMILPNELRFALFFGIGALFLLAVLKLVRT